jgi:hypothetical protein
MRIWIQVPGNHPMLSAEERSLVFLYPSQYLSGDLSKHALVSKRAVLGTINFHFFYLGLVYIPDRMGHTFFIDQLTGLLEHRHSKSESNNQSLQININPLICIIEQQVECYRTADFIQFRKLMPASYSLHTQFPLLIKPWGLSIAPGLS